MDDKKKAMIVVGIVLLVGIVSSMVVVYCGNVKKRQKYEAEEADVGIIKVTDETFNDEILESDKPVILEFTSNTCPPCLSMMPTMISIARNNDDVKVVTMNTDDSDCAKTEAKYGINSTPTILIFKDGQIINQIIGATSEDNIMKALR